MQGKNKSMHRDSIHAFIRGSPVYMVANSNHALHYVTMQINHSATCTKYVYSVYSVFKVNTSICLCSKNTQGKHRSSVYQASKQKMVEEKFSVCT